MFAEALGRRFWIEDFCGSGEPSFEGISECLRSAAPMWSLPVVWIGLGFAVSQDVSVKASVFLGFQPQIGATCSGLLHDPMLLFGCPPAPTRTPHSSPSCPELGVHQSPLWTPSCEGVSRSERRSKPFGSVPSLRAERPAEASSGRLRGVGFQHGAHTRIDRSVRLDGHAAVAQAVESSCSGDVAIAAHGGLPIIAAIERGGTHGG
jgi:hypothetical protein